MDLRFFLLTMCFLLLGTSAVLADCSDPAGKEGLMDYFSAGKTFRFCDGTVWQSMKGGGTAALPSTCSTGGRLIFDGSSWVCEDSAARTSCQEWYDSGQTADGVYLIDPDGPGAGYAPYGAYCNMSIDGGWMLAASLSTMVDTVSQPDNVAITPDSINFVLGDGKWAALRAVSTYVYMTTDSTADEGPGFMRVALARAVGGGCQDINATLIPSGLGGTRRIYAWKDPGCNYSGGDYCMMDYNNATGQLSAWNSCSSAYDIQPSADGVNWGAAGTVSFAASGATKVYLYVK